MSPLQVVEFAWGIAKLVLDMLLVDKASPQDIAAKVALEATAFYAAQAESDRLTKAKFPDYNP